MWNSVALLHHEGSSRCRDVDQRLCDAAESGDVEAVETLCGLGNSPPSSRALETALMAAIRSSHLRVVRHLCELPEERGMRLDVHYNAPLRCAAETGHLHIVKYLCAQPLTRGVHPGEMDGHALRDAARRGHLPVVRYLCELPPARGVHPGAISSRALFAAVEYGHVHVAEYLCRLPHDRGVSVVDAFPDFMEAFTFVQRSCALPMRMMRCLCTGLARRGDVWRSELRSRHGDRWGHMLAFCLVATSFPNAHTISIMLPHLESHTRTRHSQVTHVVVSMAQQVTMAARLVAHLGLSWQWRRGWRVIDRALRHLVTPKLWHTALAGGVLEHLHPTAQACAQVHAGLCMRPVDQLVQDLCHPTRLAVLRLRALREQHRASWGHHHHTLADAVRSFAK